MLYSSSDTLSYLLFSLLLLEGCSGLLGEDEEEGCEVGVKKPGSEY
jgi:hypothetical protein